MLVKWIFGSLLTLFLLLFAIGQGTLKGAPKDGNVRLRWSTDPNPARQTQTALFGKQFPGHEVEVDPGMGGDKTKLVVQCATGVGPDIIDVYSQEQMDGLVRAGILLDLTPYARELGFGLDNTYPALKHALTMRGRQYRFPANVWANAIVYNKAVFDDHGVPYPSNDWTWDQFVEVGRKFLQPGKSGETHIPLATVVDRWLFEDLLVSHGGRRFKDQGLRSALDEPAAVAALQFYVDLIYQHHIRPSPSETSAMSSQGGWGVSGMKWFSSGQAAMIPIGRWYLVIARNYPELQDQLGAALLPHLPGRPSSGIVETRAAGINAMSTKRHAALKFIQYLAGHAYGKLIVNDGDALPPNPDLATSGQALSNDTVEDPDFHQVFIDAVQRARPLDISPFIDAEQGMRWQNEVIGEVENRLVTPEAGLKRLAKEIDQTIRTNLERRRDMQRVYEEVTGEKYHPDWWKPAPIAHQ